MLQDLLDRCNIDLQSYLMLKAGLKPVIRVGIEKRVMREAETIAGKLGLECVFHEYGRFYDFVHETPPILAYYSLSRKDADMAGKAEMDGDKMKLGLMLGYPECCIENFIGTNRVDFTLKAFRKSRGRPSFYCNNLFVFDSKIRKEHQRTYEKNAGLFNNPNVRDLFLIRHVPCSYTCKRSMRIGSMTLEMLRLESPALASRIEKSLKTPVIYWDYFRWVVLDGHASGDEIRHSGSLDFDSLVDRGIRERIDESDTIKIDSDSLRLLKGKVHVGDIRRKGGIPLCIDFQ